MDIVLRVLALLVMAVLFMEIHHRLRTGKMRGTIEGARRYQLALMAFASVVLLALSACTFVKNNNSNQQAQGQEGPTSPTASPSPSADCALGSIAPGTVGDVHTIKQGGSVVIGVTLFGSQGLELVASCKSQYSPVWVSVSGPCTFSGSHEGLATAPTAAVVGTLCVGEVHVGNHAPGRLELTVTAATTLAPRTLDDPEPSPSPAPDESGVGVVDR